MARKRKEKAPTPPAWTTFKPFEPLYWVHGGPFVPVEAIDAQTLDPELMGGAMKSTKSRRCYVVILREQAVRDLERATARYLQVKAEGMKAIDPFLRQAWQEKVHNGNAYREGSADPVSEAMAWAHRDIRYYKGRIRACDAADVALERAKMTLFPQDES